MLVQLNSGGTDSIFVSLRRHRSNPFVFILSSANYGLFVDHLPPLCWPTAAPSGGVCVCVLSVYVCMHVLILGDHGTLCDLSPSGRQSFNFLMEDVKWAAVRREWSSGGLLVLTDPHCERMDEARCGVLTSAFVLICFDDFYLHCVCFLTLLLK